MQMVQEEFFVRTQKVRRWGLQPRSGSAGVGAEAKPALVRLQKSLGLTSNLMIVVSLWLLSGPYCEVLEHLSSLKRLPERGAVGWENIV